MLARTLIDEISKVNTTLNPSPNIYLMSVKTMQYPDPVYLVIILHSIYRINLVSYRFQK